MSTISIRRNHGLSHARAVEVAGAIAIRLKKDYGVISQWQGSVMHFKRPGLSGTLTFNAGQLALDVHLGFLLAALRNNIAKSIEQKLDEEFGAVPVGSKRGGE